MTETELEDKNTFLKMIYNFFDNTKGKAKKKEVLAYIEEYFHLGINRYVVRTVQQSSEVEIVISCYRIFMAILETDSKAYLDVSLKEGVW